MVHKVMQPYIFNMWALLDKNTDIVIGVLPPDATPEGIKKCKKDFNLVLMTLENSPATIGDKYKDGKFYTQKGKK